MTKKSSQLQDFCWILFLPLSWLFIFVSRALISRRSKRRFSVPVISVGNLNLGGTGKSPLVVAIANYFSPQPVAIVSRGYRGKLSHRGGMVDRLAESGASWFGDEPWMISQNTTADVFIGADRTRSFENYQIESKYKVAILDDGFQHRQIARNVDIVLLPSSENPWSSKAVPLGELRENFTSLERATHILVYEDGNPKGDRQLETGFISSLNPNAKVFPVKRSLKDLVHKHGQLQSKEGIHWGAFCGIAHPERFESDLSKKVSLSFFKAYPDHFSYSPSRIRRLMGLAQKQDVNALVTTEKDYVKLIGLLNHVSLPLFVAIPDYEVPGEFWDSLEGAVFK